MQQPLKLVVVDADDAGMRTMGDLADSYLAGRWKRREIGRYTRIRYRTVLATFADSYGQRDPAKLSMRDVERWMETRSHLATNSLANDYSTVRYFVRDLVRRGVIRRDPFAGHRGPRVPRSVPRALTLDECKAIEAVLPDSRAWAIYSLMRWVGLRRAEVHGLNVEDWDRRLGIIRVTGKGGHEREEPVPPWAAEHLRRHLAEVGAKAGPMFRSQGGTRRLSLSRISSLTRRWMEEAGVKHSAFDGRGPHSLRHTIASELVEAGADIRVVQELLGHASLTSTQIYLRRANTGRVLDAMERARAA